jgi:cation:H+ antiporter
MLGAAVALVVFLYFGLRLSRLKGFVLLVAYVAYVAAMFGLQN